MKTLVEQGSQGSRRRRQALDLPQDRAFAGWSGPVPEEEGRLSNPVQRRLSEHDVDGLVSAYLDGSSIDSLAALLGVNRTTIIGHLDRRGIDRRKSVRKMTDRSVRLAARRYEVGESLKVVAARFNVDARTLSREFKRAGIKVRPRPGWSGQA